MENIEKEKENLKVTLKDIRRLIATGTVPVNPTWFHKVGDKVRYGAHQNTEILEVLDDGLIYFVRSYGVHKVYGNDKEYEQYNYLFWIDARKIVAHAEKRVTQEKKLELRAYNADISSLLHKIYFSGIDFNPEYQRDYVWSEEDKVALIDSIFNNIEIGKFAFIKRDYSQEVYLEILDGKQRLTALREFYENCFKYKGLTFDELNNRDKWHFLNFSITYFETEEPEDRRLIYEYFIRLNTFGKVMDKEHLEKIKKLIR